MFVCFDRWLRRYENISTNKVLLYYTLLYRLRTYDTKKFTFEPGPQSTSCSCDPRLMTYFIFIIITYLFTVDKNVLHSFRQS